jgi:hypothetical protein
MSFESPAGAPTPEDAAPLTPPAPMTPPPADPQGYAPQGYAQPGQQVPPGQPAQQFQPVPPYGNGQYPPPYPPYAGYPGTPPGVAKPNAGLPVALLALSGLYVVLCLVEIFALSHRVSLANQLISDPTSVTIDQADSADNLVSTLSIVALLVFLAVIIVLSVWQRALRRALIPTGRYQAVLKESGYQIFRIVWLVSILLAIVLRGSGNLNTPQDVVSHDHQYMIYYGIRAALGGVLLYYTVRIRRTADNAVMLARSGYGPEAVNYLAR